MEKIETTSKTKITCWRVRNRPDSQGGRQLEGRSEVGFPLDEEFQGGIPEGDEDPRGLQGGKRARGHVLRHSGGHLSLVHLLREIFVVEMVRPARRTE